MILSKPVARGLCESGFEPWPSRPYPNIHRRDEFRVATLGPLTSMPLLIGANSTQEVELPKGWPISVAKVKFADGVLPQEEAGQSDLPSGTHDEVWI